MWSLIGIAVLAAGLLARLNPVIVVTAAGLAAGLGGGLHPLAILSAFGKAFNDARYVSVAFLVLPVIALMERAGLQVRARSLIGGLRAMTVGRLLTSYLALRQVSAAIGLLSLGGQASMVRPLLAPMAEGLAEAEADTGTLDEPTRMRVRAHAAAVDNIGAFFGEDIFVALGAVLLVQGVLAANHITARPAQIALWGAPTGLAAFAIHAVRLWRFDRSLRS
jgi:uncharacterized membrane protein